MTDLIAPWFKGPEFDKGELDISVKNIRLGVPRLKEWYRQTLTLFILDERKNDVIAPMNVPTPNRTSDFELELEPSLFQTDPGKVFEVFYELEGVRSSVLRFTLKLSWDRPLAVDLTARNYIVLWLEGGSTPLVPSAVNLPDYARPVRQFPNAVRYESSDPGVATVDASGTLTLLGNTGGSPVTISALDEEGNPLGSYPLQVTGVRQLSVLTAQVPLDLATASNTIEAVSSPAMQFSAPDAQDFEQLSRLYGYAPELPDDLRGATLLGLDAGGGPVFYNLEEGRIVEPSQRVVVTAIN